MNDTPLPKPDYLTIRIDGFSPSWAGADPFGDGFCIGSDDGRILFTDENGKVLDGPKAFTQSGEAVNGVAGLDGNLAATTRQEIAVFNQKKSLIETIKCGCHGVLSSSNSHFIAPLGHKGILTILPSEGIEHNRIGATSANIYSLQELPHDANHLIFVAACRSHGVGLIRFSTDTIASEIESWHLDGIDVVDAVSVGTEEYPYAAVAVGLHGEIVLFRDLIKKEDPTFLKYEQFLGTTYRVLSACGHIFVLTSKAIYVIGNLAARLAQQSLGEHNAPVMTLPMEAIDANIVGNRWLLAVMEDEIHRYDVHQIHDLISGSVSNELDVTSRLPHSIANAGNWLPNNSIQQVVATV